MVRHWTPARALWAGWGLVILLSCRHNVVVELRPQVSPDLLVESTLAEVRPPLVFLRGDMVDLRLNPEQFGWYAQGVHSYTFLGDRPMDHALYGGLATVFRGAGHQWVSVEAGDLWVHLELLEAKATFINSTAPKASTALDVRVIITETEPPEELLYAQVYHGRDSRSNALRYTGLVKDSFRASLDSLLLEIANDPELAQALRDYVDRSVRPTRVGQSLRGLPPAGRAVSGGLRSGARTVEDGA